MQPCLCVVLLRPVATRCFVRSGRWRSFETSLPFGAALALVVGLPWRVAAAKFSSRAVTGSRN